MSELLPMALVLGAGFVLGTIFYIGLWWTVKKGLPSNHIGLWFTVSPLLRITVAMSGIYLVGQGDWKRFLLCFAGFIIARIMVILLTKHIDLVDRVNHAA